MKKPLPGTNRRSRLRLAAVSALLLLYGCSKEQGPDIPPAPEPPNPELPHSAEIRAGSNMPVDGVLTAQYSDYPEGSDIAKIADENPETGYRTDHSRFYLLFEAAEAVVIDHYSLTVGADCARQTPVRGNCRDPRTGRSGISSTVRRPSSSKRVTRPSSMHSRTTRHTPFTGWRSKTTAGPSTP